MNSSQKLGLFILITISVAYVYFSFFNKSEIDFHLPKREEQPPIADITDVPDIQEFPEEQGQKVTEKKDYKSIKIFVLDSHGNIRSVNRKCDTDQEKSCFAFAIKELIEGPTRWEKSKGFTSEIPQGTKILSIRESDSSVMIDLSSAFEGGGGAESTYTRVMQIIKTAKANTNLPVYLYINGKQADVIGGEGIMIKQPLNERSLDD